MIVFGTINNILNNVQVSMYRTAQNQVTGWNFRLYRQQKCVFFNLLNIRSTPKRIEYKLMFTLKHKLINVIFSYSVIPDHDILIIYGTVCT